MAATFKIEQQKDYTIMANHHLRNKSLSLKAKGLQSLMLSLPEDWDYTLKGLAAICGDGVDSISSALKELEQAGYVVRSRVRNERGQLTGTEYIIYQIPRINASEGSTDEKKPKRENPVQAEKCNRPEPEKPIQENPIQVTSPKRDFPILDKPEQAEPVQEKQPQLNIQESITNKSITYPINPSGIYNNYNNTTTGKIKNADEIDGIREYIHDNIDYKRLCKDYGKATIDGIVDIMTEVYMSDTTVTISNQTMSASYVQSVFDKIDYDHIVYVLDSFAETSKTHKIRNIKKYLLAALYNAPMTYDCYQTAEASFGEE